MTMEQYKQVVKPRLTPYRWKHSVNVSKAAVHLAKKYGADPEKAEVAGILHDVMKDTPAQEQLQYMQRFGIMLSAVELSSSKLWHAMSGAAFIEHDLGVDDPEILRAVRYHTTARPDMGLLEKVIYIADFISEERDYDGVEHMRAAAEKSLEKAMMEGLSFTLQDLAGRRLPIHPDTFAAFNQLAMEQTKKKEK